MSSILAEGSCGASEQSEHEVNRSVKESNMVCLFFICVSSEVLFSDYIILTNEGAELYDI
jgi:hypothetical protein